MTKKEFEKRLKAMDRVVVKATASPESARQFLREVGLIDKNNRVVPKYR